MLQLAKVEIPLSIQMMASTGYFHLTNHSQPPATALPGTGLSGLPSAQVETQSLIPRMDCNGQVIQLFLHKETMLHMAKIVRAMVYGL